MRVNPDEDESMIDHPSLVTMTQVVIQDCQRTEENCVGSYEGAGRTQEGPGRR